VRNETCSYNSLHAGCTTSSLTPGQLAADVIGMRADTDDLDEANSLGLPVGAAAQQGKLLYTG
jgi:hypothetical protein